MNNIASHYNIGLKTFEAIIYAVGHAWKAAEIKE